MRTEEEIRRRWLARLGRPADLAFPFFAVESVREIAPGRTVALGELCTGRIAVGDALEAIGYTDAPVAIRVERIERADVERRGVVASDEGLAGDILGVTLEHDRAARLEAGQGLAPAGSLSVARRIEADVWLAPSGDLPGTDEEQRLLVEELAEGRGLELFFHTRAVAARALAPWRPELGREYVLEFELERPVPLYPSTRFGLLYEGLTVGAGFVSQS